MSLVLSRLKRTMSSIFRIGDNTLESNSGILETKDADGTDYAEHKAKKLSVVSNVDNTKRVGIDAPDTILNNYDLTLPRDVPARKTPMLTDTSGDCSFGTVEGVLLGDFGMTAGPTLISTYNIGVATGDLANYNDFLFRWSIGSTLAGTANSIATADTIRIRLTPNIFPPIGAYTSGYYYTGSYSISDSSGTDNLGGVAWNSGNGTASSWITYTGGNGYTSLGLLSTGEMYITNLNTPFQQFGRQGHIKSVTWYTESTPAANTYHQLYINQYIRLDPPSNVNESIASVNFSLDSGNFSFGSRMRVYGMR